MVFNNTLLVSIKGQFDTAWNYLGGKKSQIGSDLHEIDLQACE